MSTTNEIRYLASHEWGRIDEEGILTVGISDHAQDLLGASSCQILEKLWRLRKNQQ